MRPLAEITGEYADKLIASDLKSLPPERRAKVTDAQIAEVRDRLIKQATELASVVNDKPALWESCRRGRLDPCNQASRMVFENVTGLKLPSSSSATNKFIAEYVGHHVVDASRKAREDAALAEEQERDDKRRKLHDANIARITQSLTSNGRIGGEDLIDIAKHLAIELHPRTVGSIRKNVVWIEQGQAQISNRKFDTQTAHKLLREVCSRINAI